MGCKEAGPAGRQRDATAAVQAWRWRLDEGGRDGLGDTKILKTVLEVELTGLAFGHNVGGEGTRNQRLCRSHRPEPGGDGTLLTDVGGGTEEFPLGHVVSCPVTYRRASLAF